MTEAEKSASGRRPRASALPAGVLPRGLSLPQAAEYVGVGVTKFEELVGDGRMPRPKRIDARKVWDRLALDESLAALAEDGQA